MKFTNHGGSSQTLAGPLRHARVSRGSSRHSRQIISIPKPAHDSPGKLHLNLFKKCTFKTFPTDENFLCLEFQSGCVQVYGYTGPDPDVNVSLQGLIRSPIPKLRNQVMHNVGHDTVLQNCRVDNVSEKENESIRSEEIHV